MLANILHNNQTRSEKLAMWLRGIDASIHYLVSLISDVPQLKCSGCLTSTCTKKATHADQVVKNIRMK